jgi:hypothetical protein
MKLHGIRTLLLLIQGLMACIAYAQSLRDPTIAPTLANNTAASASGRGTRAPMSILSVNGKFHLMVGTRLYSQGQKIGESLIVSIGETEVWFCEGAHLRKVSNFSGVRRLDTSSLAQAPLR